MDIDLELKFNRLLEAAAGSDPTGQDRKDVADQTQKELYDAGLIQESLSPNALQEFLLAGINGERTFFRLISFHFAMQAGTNIFPSAGPQR